MQYLKQRWRSLNIQNGFEALQILFLSLFFLECVIGGSGRIVSFGYLSLRMILFAICFFLTLPAVLRSLKTLIKQPFTWIWAIFFVVLGISAVHGFLLDYPLRFIRQDITIFLTLLLYPGVAVLLSSKERVRWVVDLIFIGSILVAAATLLIHVLLSCLSPFAMNALNDFINRISFGGFAALRADYYRIYLKSQIFLQFGAMIGLYKLVQCQTRGQRFLLMVIEIAQVYAMILSYTRGFWLGFAVSCVVLLVCSRGSFVKYMKALGGLCIGLCCMFLLSFALYGNNDALLCVAERIGMTLEPVSFRQPFLPDNSVVESVEESVEESMNESIEDVIENANESAQSIRVLTMQEHKRLIRENPLWGYGLGKNLDGIRSDGRTEYTYVDLLMKLGLFGFLSFLLVFCSHAAGVLGRALFGKKQKAEQLSVYLAAGYVGVFVTSYLNPFLTSPMGIVMLFAVIVAVRSDRPRTDVE